MYISARERQILEILLSEKKEHTVKDIADNIGVSVRTVHRDLKNIEDILAKYHLSLQKKAGVGVRVTGASEKIRELELFLFNLYHKEYTPEERQTMILCTLLETKGPVKLIALANDLNVTIATVSSDLTKLEDRIETYGLSLIRRRGYGVEINGKEGSKRRAMRDIISEQLDESEILSLARENIQKRSSKQINTISERLLGLVAKNKLMIVEKVVDSFNKDLPYSMADSSYIGLVVHLALAIERIEKGEGISIDRSFLDKQKSSKEYVFAKRMVDELEKVFQIDIPEAEIGYIMMHLMGAKLRHDKDYMIEDSNLRIAVKTKNLVQIVGESLGKDLSQNHSLFEGLVLHLKPALYRLKQNMGISNPLLDRMKQDYPELFKIVKEGANTVFEEYTIPDEEIGYLVMHFGAAVLNAKETGSIKALVLCSSGIGTSKMLVTRLQREFPEMKEIKSASLFEFESLNHQDFQLIISTIPIPEFNQEYFLVSPILTAEEIDQLRTVIQERFKGDGLFTKTDHANHEQLRKKSAKSLLEELHVIEEYARTIAAILQNFTITRILQNRSTKTILEQICRNFLEKQIIDDMDGVVQATLAREKLGGLGIPGTTMALYHARSPHVLTPVFNIYGLQEPLPVVGMDNQIMEMKQLVLLLAPESATEPTLEILSFLSSTLIESEQTISIFESNHQEKVSELLAAKLDAFFYKKIQEKRGQ